MFRTLVMSYVSRADRVEHYGQPGEPFHWAVVFLVVTVHLVVSLEHSRGHDAGEVVGEVVRRMEAAVGLQWGVNGELLRCLTKCVRKYSSSFSSSACYVMLHHLRSDSASATASDSENSVGPSGPRGEGAVGPGASEACWAAPLSLTAPPPPRSPPGAAGGSGTGTSRTRGGLSGW